MTLLDPQSNRTLYTDALTPPPRFRFDCAVGLTYSLGLDTLLAVPLHLLLHAGGRSQPRLLKDRIAVLDGLRRTAKNLSIFHQNGRILAPRGRRVLYSLLEDSVFRTFAPRGGLFHPKVWLLRFRPEADESAPDRHAEDAPRIRLAVLSRNLTTDRSWDVSLTVEGQPGIKEVDGNEELVTLLAALPKCAPELPHGRAAQIADLAHDLARTDWELPDGIDELRLHAIGLNGDPWSPPRSKRLVVMSPFCTSGALERLSRTSDSATALVSRPEELVRLSQGSHDVIGLFERCLVLRETAEGEDDDASPRRGTHMGLHAKLYLCDEEDATRLFVGSANSTHPALIGATNVEVMVELAGNQKRLGSVDQFLGMDGFGALLEDFDPNDVESPSPQDADARNILERACDAVVAAELRLSCREAADDGRGKESIWQMRLVAGRPIHLGPGLRATAWPITLPRGRNLDCRPLLGSGEIVFGPMDVSSVTRFIAFEIAFEGDKPSAPPQAFVLRMPTHGLPVQERDEAVVRQVVRNRDGFLRYLMFLLGDFDAFAGGNGPSPESRGTRDGSGFGVLPLLEQMTRAFCRDPSRLESVRRLVEHLRDLEGAGKDGEVVPQDFLELWDTFESALPGGGS